MKPLYFLIGICLLLVLQLRAQDTLFLKSGVKYPCNVRKAFFLRESEVTVRLLLNGSLTGVTFKTEDIQYFVTKDTLKLRRISNTNFARLGYFRYLDTNGAHINAVELLNRVTKEEVQRDYENKVSKKTTTNYLGISFGPTMQLANRPVNVGLDDELNLRYYNNYSLGIEYLLVGNNNFGIGSRFGANLGVVKMAFLGFSNHEQETPFKSFSVAVGPVYNIPFQKILFRLSFYYGLVTYQIDKVNSTQILSSFGVRNGYEVSANKTEQVLNPAVNFSYRFHKNFELFCLLNLLLYQTELNIIRSPDTRTLGPTPNAKVAGSTIMSCFLDYRLGINLLF